MVNDKINLMISNSVEIDNVNGTFGMSIFKKCNALTLTLKNTTIDVSKVNLCRDIIKGNTSMFSNFRGNNLLTTAVNLSLEENPEESLKEVIDIYNKLKDVFMNSQYLVLAAWVLYKSRNKFNIDGVISDTRKAYDFMKGNHWFLTGADDVSAAAMIAVTSTNLEKTFSDIEECYTILKKQGFWAGNNLQGLSHILSLSEDSSEHKCTRVISLNNALKNNSIPLKSYALPILGVASMVTDDYEALAKNIKETSEFLKTQKGFGSFSLGTTVRNMISASLVCMNYIDSLTNESKDTLINTTTNAVLTIVIAMEIAAASASAGAAAAAASSSSC